MRMKIDGIDINYKVEGNGNNVLILHGWGVDMKPYMKIYNHLVKNNKVYILDMPGFGESEEPSEPWNVSNYVDFIVKFIEKNKIKELSIIGHSFGGRVIIKMVNEKIKFKVNKIVLMGSAGIKHKASLKNKTKEKIYKTAKKIVFNKLVQKLYPNALDKLKGKMGSTDYKNATPVMRESLVMTINEDLSELLDNISQPTLLIWGTNDTETPYEDAKEMESVIPNAGLVTIQGGSHYAFLEDPVTVCRALDSFLN